MLKKIEKRGKRNLFRTGREGVIIERKHTTNESGSAEVGGDGAALSAKDIRGRVPCQKKRGSWGRMCNYSEGTSENDGLKIASTNKKRRKGNWHYRKVCGTEG